jgi:hypothetical protein
MESVTPVTEVTPHRGVYRKNILDILENLMKKKMEGILSHRP